MLAAGVWLLSGCAGDDDDAAAGTGGSSGAPSLGGSSGKATSDAGTLPTTDAGLAIYTVECAGDPRPCAFPAADCLGIFLEQGLGFACSNACSSPADCSTAPTEAEAQVECSPLAVEEQDRCLLVCERNGQSFACPEGMSCHPVPDSGASFCLWTTPAG
jgi:hypothetical protein